MSNVAVLLDKAKETLKASSDAELARHLGVTRASVSNWRTGRNLPDVVQCATIAGLTGEPLARVLGIVGEARAISREEKTVWRRLAASAAAVLVLVGVSGMASPSVAKDGNANMYYAKSRRRDFLTTLQLIALWLKWKFFPKKTGPDCIEAFAC